jgi:hypothetical protein
MPTDFPVGTAVHELIEAPLCVAGGSRCRAMGCRVVARVAASTQVFDVRYTVTTPEGSAKNLYETVYCARGRVKNFIKLHKTLLASECCRSVAAAHSVRRRAQAIELVTAGDATTSALH